MGKSRGKKGIKGWYVLQAVGWMLTFYFLG